MFSASVTWRRPSGLWTETVACPIVAPSWPQNTPHGSWIQ
jgi:hypothetical protein